MATVEICDAQKRFKAEYHLRKIKPCQHRPVLCTTNAAVLFWDPRAVTFPRTNPCGDNTRDCRLSTGSPRADRAVRSQQRKLVGGWNHFGNSAVCHNLSGHEIQSRNISTHENHLHLNYARMLRTSLWCSHQTTQLQQRYEQAPDGSPPR